MSEFSTNLFVTGGCGFIGSNFIRFILDKYDRINIINLDLLTYAGNSDSLKDIKSNYGIRYKFIKGDICGEDLISSILRENNITGIINFAAESHVDRSIEDPNIFVKTNVLGTANLLNSAKKYWNGNYQGKRFLQISTDEVYGTLPEDKPEMKFTESTPLNPHSPYSASKTSADLIAGSYFDTFGFPVMITRCSNNYGPYQFPEKLIPLMITRALNNEDMPVYGDGNQIRDWLYVEDHCSAIWKVFQKAEPGSVYNIGGNNEIKNIDIVKMILNHLGRSHSLIKYVKDRPGHDRRYAVDASKIEKELGWKPQFEFSEKIKDTIDWYIKNYEWINKIFRK